MSTKYKRFDRWRFNIAAAAAFAVAVTTGCSKQAGGQPEQPANTAAASKPAEHNDGKVEIQVPASLAAEHRELHEELETALGSGGQTAEAADAVEKLLSAHFVKEEQYALPQLGLLVPLAEGKYLPEMKKAIELSDKLKAEMPEMLAEHKGIVAALDRLRAAAEAENKPQAAQFARNLAAHAQNEEQITYPAAILVGEYLKLKPER